MNCRLLGLDFFYLGLTLEETRKFVNFRMWTNTFVQNLPQLGLQVVILALSQNESHVNVNMGVYVSLSTSVLSMTSALLAFWLYQRAAFRKYSFELVIELNLKGIPDHSQREALRLELKEKTHCFRSISRPLANYFENTHDRQVQFGNINVVHNKIIIYGNILWPNEKQQRRQQQELLQKQKQKQRQQHHWRKRKDATSNNTSGYLLLNGSDNDDNDQATVKSSVSTLTPASKEMLQTIDVQKACNELLLHGFKMEKNYGEYFRSRQISFKSEWKIFEFDSSYKPKVEFELLPLRNSGVQELDI
ncbi:hypothetical protein RFI_01174 [Reticulomyxa filosa]|uniref:Uncharacterized protein n=1 Tax=Reticulomyxa filosa TaxID=46433 RepID=X6PCT3_RETFI|nr:hypothetical protein RFI_01174 [Reticulomyxa filosa]|eukprot:ETO35888.1 hypothetical protein RFI_01174 [Reticulomyxa filosa]